MIKLREFTDAAFGMKFNGNTALDQLNNSIIHHDPSASFDLEFLKA